MQFGRATVLGALAWALTAIAAPPAQAHPVEPEAIDTLRAHAGVGATSAPPVRASRRSRGASLPPGAVAFDLNVGGLRLGRLVLETDRQGPFYRARAQFATAGVAANVWRARLDAVAEGHVRATGWQAKRFEAKTASGSKRQDLEILWQGTTPTAVTAVPPFDPKPWEIEAVEQTGTSDPLSAFMGTLTVPQGSRPCDRSAEIYDGRRRYRVSLGAPERVGQEGRGRRCSALFERLAGYKPKQMAKPPVRLKVLYRAAPEGGWRLQRVATSTPFGTAVLVRVTDR